MDVEDEVDRHAIVATDKSRKEGTEVVPIAVPDHPQVGGVKAAPEISKQRPNKNVGIVAGKAIEKASVRRGRPIRKKLSQTRKMAMITLRRRLSRSQNSMKVSNSKPNEVW